MWWDYGYGLYYPASKPRAREPKPRSPPRRHANAADGSIDSPGGATDKLGAGDVDPSTLYCSVQNVEQPLDRLSRAGAAHKFSTCTRSLNRLWLRTLLSIPWWGTRLGVKELEFPCPTLVGKEGNPERLAEE